MTTPIRRSALLALGCLLVPLAAHAQLGGLIKKQVDKKVDKKVEEASAEPPKFDNETLELTPERLDKLIRGKEAVRAFAEGPNGPEGLRRKLAPIDERRTKLYEKLVDKINAWDGRRMEIERCVGDSLSERRDKKMADFERRSRSEPAMLQKMIQLAQAMAQAQQKGDAAEMLRIQKEIQSLQEPSAQDSAEVKRKCGDPTPPPDVAEYLSLDQAVKQLEQAISKAEQTVRDMESTETGMNNRQLAIACDRIRAALERLKKKMAEVGMSPVEWQALKERADKLEKLCP